MAPHHARPNGVRRLNVLVTGVYAWGATVLVPVLRFPGARSVALAGAALAALLGGVALLRARPRIGLALGLHGFLACAVLLWWSVPAAISPRTLNAPAAAFGAVGWVLFALAWGSPRPPGAVPERDPRSVGGAPLEPRGALRRGAVSSFLFSLTLAPALLLLPFRIARPEHALLGQAIGAVSALAVIGAAAAVASARPAGPRPRTRARLLAAAPALALVAALAVVGLVSRLLAPGS